MSCSDYISVQIHDSTCGLCPRKKKKRQITLVEMNEHTSLCSGEVAGGANPRTFAYLSVFSSLLVIMRRNTGLPPPPNHAATELVIAKGIELTHVILAFGSRRLDQFEIFMSPHATVTPNSFTQLMDTEKSFKIPALGFFF